MFCPLALPSILTYISAILSAKYVITYSSRFGGFTSFFTLLSHLVRLIDVCSRAASRLEVRQEAWPLSNAVGLCITWWASPATRSMQLPSPLIFMIVGVGVFVRCMGDSVCCPLVANTTSWPVICLMKEEHATMSRRPFSRNCPSYKLAATLNCFSVKRVLA